MSNFQEQLTAFAQTAVVRVSQCANEEQTKLYLVLPFLRLLGYDALDPSQVVAESSADFSDKYKNRVDFLLMANGTPAIALECLIKQRLVNVRFASKRGHCDWAQAIIPSQAEPIRLAPLALAWIRRDGS